MATDPCVLPFASPQATPSDHDPGKGKPVRITVDEPEAVRITGLSGKTLKRMSDAGARLGRLKVGRKTLFVLADLEAHLKSLANQPDASAQDVPA